MTKEDKILEILTVLECYVMQDRQEECASKISALFENMYEGEFVEWLAKNIIWRAFIEEGQQRMIPGYEIESKEYTIKQAHDFWLARPENRTVNKKVL